MCMNADVRRKGIQDEYSQICKSVPINPTYIQHDPSYQIHVSACRKSRRSCGDSSNKRNLWRVGYVQVIERILEFLIRIALDGVRLFIPRILIPITSLLFLLST